MLCSVLMKARALVSTSQTFCSFTPYGFSHICLIFLMQLEIKLKAVFLLEKSFSERQSICFYRFHYTTHIAYSVYYCAKKFNMNYKSKEYAIMWRSLLTWVFGKYLGTQTVFGKMPYSTKYCNKNNSKNSCSCILTGEAFCLQHKHFWF